MPQVGELIRIDGYHISATIESVRGGGPPDTQEWVVFNNSSSHWFLGHREPGSRMVTVVETWVYGGEYEPAVSTYSLALCTAVVKAISH